MFKSNMHLVLNYKLILIFYAKEWLTLLDGELGEYRTCPKNLSVAMNIMPKNLGENSPIF